jgi:hypothetical protein
MGINTFFNRVKCPYTLAKKRWNLPSVCLQMSTNVNTVVISLLKWKTSVLGTVNTTRENLTTIPKLGPVVVKNIIDQPSTTVHIAI